MPPSDFSRKTLARASRTNFFSKRVLRYQTTSSGVVKASAMKLGGEKTGRITFLAESLLGGGGGGVGGCGERKEKKSDEELAEGRHVSAVAEMTVLDDEHREANGGGREEVHWGASRADETGWTEGQPATATLALAADVGRCRRLGDAGRRSILH